MRALSREDVVAEFHKAFGHPIDVTPSTELIILRNNLIFEEYHELKDELAAAMVDVETLGEITQKTKERILKEMADLQYVLSGLAVVLGLPLHVAFNRVHKSNMSKLGVDGKPILREDGKILKGPNYAPPDLEDLVE
jgi:predicted HAD superfamily Cof-like phosphohydrolase